MFKQLLLADKDQLTRALAEKLLTYATGSIPTSGDRAEIEAIVASGAGIWCGECEACIAGRTNLCERYATIGLSRDGGLAQYCRVPAITCVDIEAYGITEDTAGLGQPMAIGVHAMRRGRLAAGEDAAIVGAGGIGAEGPVLAPTADTKPPSA